MTKVLPLLILTVAIAGCSTYSMQTATAPISAQGAEQIVDGQSTRVDVISLFGNPNGYIFGAGAVGVGAMVMAQSGVQNAMPTTGSDLMHYKDCITTSKAKIGLISGSLIIPRGTTVEVCKVFTALLNKDNVVIAHVYLDNNFVTEEKRDEISVGMDKSDVIRHLGGPTSVAEGGDKEIYIYKTCLTKSAAGSWNPYRQDMRTRSSCQQTTIVLGKDNKVEKTSFIPWDTSNI